MKNIINVLWIGFCIIAGAVIGAVLLSGMKSMPLAIVGGLIGAVLGGLFGRFVPLSDALLTWLD